MESQHKILLNKDSKQHKKVYFVYHLSIYNKENWSELESVRLFCYTNLMNLTDLNDTISIFQNHLLHFT